MINKTYQIRGIYDGIQEKSVFAVRHRDDRSDGGSGIRCYHVPVLLCGLLLGPVRGGLAAGIGSMIFDLMTPEYAPEAWITFLRFFLMV